MKLEDTKPATLEKVVDEEGGGGGVPSVHPNWQMESSTLLEVGPIFLGPAL